MNKFLGRLRKQIGVSKFNLSDSYTSLLLGIVVVLILAIFAVLLINNQKPMTSSVKPEIISEELEKVKQDNNTQTSYTVVVGDTLWSIAEKQYSSGYEWVNIAKANNIVNPHIIEVGTTLTLPRDESKILATSTMVGQTQAVSITGKSYTVEGGDTLWDIAVRAYGDGFKWTELAKVNNVVNPDLIYPGNVLTIPR